MIYPRVSEITDDLEGLYRIDHEPYHRGPGISSSSVKDALVSQGDYYYNRVNPKEPTPAMAFGTAFHMALLEPDLFEKRYVVPPEFSGAGMKARKEAWQAEHDGAEIIKADDQAKLDAMVLSVTSHPLWSTFKTFDRELMAIERDKNSGLLLKCKADLIGSCIVDVKTTSSAASPSEFRQACRFFGYHTSAAFYQDLVASVTGIKMRFIHVVVEKSAPHGAAFYEMTDEFLAEGRKLYHAGLDQIILWNNKMHRGKSIHSYGVGVIPLAPNAQVLYNTKDVLENIGAVIDAD